MNLGPEIIAAFSVMGAAVGALWVRLEVAFSRVEKRLKKCEADREKLWFELASKR